MAKDNRQKIKLLYLMEMLRQDTDEQHPLTTSEICRRLGVKGITCERRTVGMDMKVLNDFGYEVMSCTVGHEKAYYVDDRSFSGSIFLNPRFNGLSDKSPVSSYR